MNNNMNIIAQALVRNSTIANNKEATINGGQVGIDTYATWKTALENAHRNFYKYECATIIASIDPDKSTKDAKSEAFKSLQAILDLVGEVNGHALHKSEELLNNLSKYSILDRKQLTGNAEFINSQLKNLKAEFNKPNNGASEEWIADMEKRIAAKEEELKLAKKQTDSASKFKTRAKYGTFATKMECALAQIIKGQEAKTWEELEAEEQARKDAAKARRKAARQANKTNKK